MEHGAWSIVAQLAAVVVLAPEPRNPFLGPDASRDQLDQHVPFRCQSDHPSSLPETRSGLMASQKSGPLDWFQCTTQGIAWSTQKPTVLGATARRSIFVPLLLVMCLADCALQPNRSNVSTKVAVHPWRRTTAA